MPFSGSPARLWPALLALDTILGVLLIIALALGEGSFGDVLFTFTRGDLAGGLLTESDALQALEFSGSGLAGVDISVSVLVVASARALSSKGTSGLESLKGSDSQAALVFVLMSASFGSCFAVFDVARVRFAGGLKFTGVSDLLGFAI